MQPTALIYETIVTTVAPDGASHVAPMGVRYREAAGERQVLLMPFKPSRTLDNVRATGCAVLNFTTDVRVFAGCVTGRHDWPLVSADRVPGVRLAECLGHAELALIGVQDDATRPVLNLRVAHEARHGHFAGFNRAQSAVLEAAVLVSRLHMLPPEKVDAERAYLQIAIDKTAGPMEHEAWGWLIAAIAEFRVTQTSTTRPAPGPTP